MCVVCLMPIGFSIAVSIAFLLHVFHLPVMYISLSMVISLMRGPSHFTYIWFKFDVSFHRHRCLCVVVYFFFLFSHFWFYVLLYSFAATMHFKPIQVHLMFGLQMHFFTPILTQSVFGFVSLHTIYKFITHSKLRIYIITVVSLDITYT